METVTVQELPLKRFETILDMALNKILKEIDQVKQEVRTIKSHSVVTEAPKKIIEPEPIKEQQTTIPEQPKREVSPRVGNYESSDVSIEQFFYCGNH